MLLSLWPSVRRRVPWIGPNHIRPQHSLGTIRATTTFRFTAALEPLALCSAGTTTFALPTDVGIYAACLGGANSTMAETLTSSASPLSTAGAVDLLYQATAAITHPRRAQSRAYDIDELLLLAALEDY